MLEFEWDPEKDKASLRKHGVDFEEASTVFGDPLATTVPDPRHFEGEYRFVTTGYTSRQRLVVVWHTERGQRIRIIGVRQGTPGERRLYESGT